MKSKITLIVLIVVIVFFAALSFFFGYKYLNSDEKINELTAQVEQLSNNPNIQEETTQEPQVQTVEKLAIPQIDLNKIEKIDNDNIVDYKLTSEHIRESENVSYLLGKGTTYTPMSVENYDYQFLFKGKGYTFENKSIVEVKYQYLGATAGYYVLLFDDGTVSYTRVEYTLESPTLEFIDTGLQNVVKLSTIGIEYQNGRVVPYVCAITSDGITHIIDYATQE